MAKHILNPLIGGQELDIATPLFGGDVESHEDTQPAAVNVVNAGKINHNLRRPRQRISDSFAEDGTFISEHDTAVAHEHNYIAAYLGGQG
ncbi:MAG TPA: hypothetical protein VKB60_06145 [Terriglobales bacterium]|nr:hypothetical protein [Terriglobales bacterium]